MQNAVPLTCLVLEPVAVVAEDLQAMIRDEVPEARVLVAASTAEAHVILQTERVDIAFVNLTPTELEHTDLVLQIEAKGAAVVFLDSWPDAGPKRRVLELPFVQPAVARELRAVMGQRTDCGAG